ncbi:radical SAM protein, partial [bacterium]
EPAFITQTAAFVAELKGLSFEDIGRITARGAKELFGIGEAEGAKIAYSIRDSLYLNVTAKCTNRCVFCPKNRDSVVKGHDLSLRGGDPSAEELLKAVESEGGPARWSEVVFCGYGEPLTRLDAVLKVARELKKRGARRIRVNTDGLGNLYHGRDITGELAQVVDSISISLNAPTKEQYNLICRPSLDGAYESMLDFLAKCAKKIPEVTATAVAMEGVDIKACAEMARAAGAKFRSRPYNELG